MDGKKRSRAPVAAAVIIVWLWPGIVRAQSGLESGRPPERPSLTLAEAGGEFLRDAGLIWSSPARIRARDIAPLLALAAATAVLVSADERTRNAVQGYAARHSWVGDVGPVVTLMGNEGAWGTA